MQNECHGSIQVIRHVTELHESIDVVMTADHALIPMLMYSTIDEDSGQPYGEWYIRFAGNRMALAYTPNSRYAAELDSSNWVEILSRPDVKIGLADPRFDATGYRALMVMTLAEDEYQVKGLHDHLFRDAFTYPVTRFAEDGLTDISVPEILEPKSDSNVVQRGSSIQLLALLESGDIDYAFEYESVIVAMLFVSLPYLVNMSREAFAMVERELEMTALVEGASEWQAFFLVTLPLAWRGIVSGALMMWARGISEFGAVVIIAYNPKIVPVLIYERFEGFGLSVALPVAALLILTAFVVFFVLRLVLLPEKD